MSENKETTRLRELAPRDELEFLIREATTSVEADLALEDAGWINLSGTTGDVITAAERITNLKLSRLYSTKDPMGKQSIRLWTDYTFGSGMSSHSDEDKTEEVRKSFWNSKDNQNILSTRGQRKSSDKLLIDGEVFFVIFLGTKGSATIRWIDPLEITEIITDPDDKENVMYYRRMWSDTQSKSRTTIYRSTTNLENEATKDALGTTVEKTDDGLVYHLTYNTITQRGNPLLLPALIWMKYLNKQLSSYIAVDIAQGIFVLRSKVKGGQVAVDAIKAQTHGKDIPAGSTLLENMGVDTSSFTIDKRAKNAYDGARLTKLQVSAAVGIPEQYFGDLATGNLATAKTVELPMMKMFQSYQAIWADAYQDIDEIVFVHNGIKPEKWYVDRDFPAISPVDYVAMAQSIQQIIQSMPEFGLSPDVQQQALLSIGINDPGEVLDFLSKEAKKNPSIPLARALRRLREIIEKE